MYKNKNNGKIATEIVTDGDRIYFTIDGIKTSLEPEIFEANYEKIDE